MIIRIVVSGWILGCLALGSWIAWMALDNVPPYEYDVEASKIVPDPAPQEAMITVDWSLRQVRRKCPATVQRMFRDHETGKVVSTLDTTEASRSVQVGDDRLPRSFQLPPNLPPVAEYEAIVCFQCNALQKLIEPLCVPTPRIIFRTLASRP